MLPIVGIFKDEFEGQVINCLNARFFEVETDNVHIRFSGLACLNIVKCEQVNRLSVNFGIYRADIEVFARLILYVHLEGDIIIVILMAGQPVNWFGFAMIPVALVLMLIFSLGCAYLVSTITVFVSDVGYFMSVAMRLVVWVTPTFFFLEDAKI